MDQFILLRHDISFDDSNRRSRRCSLDAHSPDYIEQMFSCQARIDGCLSNGFLQDPFVLVMIFPYWYRLKTINRLLYFEVK